MELFIYEHCPYCVKARMIFGLKNKPVQLCYLLNDEEQAVIRMVGVKQVPVLKIASNTYMKESLDIIRFVDELEAPLIRGKQSAAIGDWLSRVSLSWRPLTMSHFGLLALPEFATRAAVDYYTQKKERLLGAPLVQLRLKRPLYVEEINIQLVQLVALIRSEEAVNGELSFDDFHLFAVLRALTLFKDIRYPSKVRRYLETLSKLSQVELLFHQALAAV
ncbi:MAG: glutaredoxin 2 [Neisseriaceae bacterium]